MCKRNNKFASTQDHPVLIRTLRLHQGRSPDSRVIVLFAAFPNLTTQWLRVRTDYPITVAGAVLEWVLRLSYQRTVPNSLLISSSET
jgi:hypothetical protein